MQTKSHIRTPELEHNAFNELIHYLEHGYPCSLVRWHSHEEHELHLIVATSGKLFVGDYIGDFAPGHLVLTGPRLPHNWISNCSEQEAVPLRDMVIQFSHKPIDLAAKSISELREILPLLERSAYGIEFFGLGTAAEENFARIRDARGAQRFACFIEFMCLLARHSNYRLLSSSQIQSFDDDGSHAKINTVLNYIADNYSSELSADMFCEKLNMSHSNFSRFFRKATGNNFTDFVNRVRINKACQLLMDTDQYVNNVCYDVGFNNVANFNRRFLKLKGTTPKEFRRKAEDRFGAESQ